jgi:hypothetical protein
MIGRINFLSVRRYVSRGQLDDYWRRTCEKVKRGRLLRINPFGLGINAFRETKLAIHFFYNMNREVVRSG